MDPVSLTGKQYQQLRDAICKAFVSMNLECSDEPYGGRYGDDSPCR